MDYGRKYTFFYLFFIFFYFWCVRKYEFIVSRNVVSRGLPVYKSQTYMLTPKGYISGQLIKSEKFKKPGSKASASKNYIGEE